MTPPSPPPPVRARAPAAGLLPRPVQQPAPPAVPRTRGRTSDGPHARAAAVCVDGATGRRTSVVCSVAFRRPVPTARRPPRDGAGALFGAGRQCERRLHVAYAIPNMAHMP
eukprot:1193847-Prymnesium_polylepis.1